MIPREVEVLLKEHEAISYMLSGKNFSLEYGDEVLVKTYLGKIQSLVVDSVGELSWGDFRCDESGVFYGGDDVCSIRCRMGESAFLRVKLLMAFLVVPYVLEELCGLQ